MSGEPLRVRSLHHKEGDNGHQKTQAGRSRSTAYDDIARVFFISKKLRIT